MKFPYKSAIVLGLVISTPYISLGISKARGEIKESPPSVFNFVEDQRVKSPKSVKERIIQSLNENSKPPEKLEIKKEEATSYKDKLRERLNFLD